MKIKIYHLILFFFTLNNFSQETKISIKEYINFSDLPSKTSDTPRWADQFYTNLDQINIKKLKTEINDWIIEEKKERKEKRNKEIDKITNKASEKEFESELKESISENPIVRFAINFTKKIPSEWITDKGYLDLPTKSTFFKNAENQEKTRKTVNKKNEDKNVLASNWSQIGSMEIVQNDVQIVRSTNVYFISIAPSATDTRLASTETGVIFKTTDGGANWNYINDYTGPSAFHPTDADKIILGSNPFRISSDGGATWTIKPVSSSCNEILWSNDGTTILAATNQGIYVSSDAGSSFSLKQTGTFMDVEFKPGSSTIAYAIDNAGNFYKSNNAGLTWVLKPTNYTLTTNKDGFLLGVTAANPDLVSIAFLTGQNTELIKSTNGGENFAPLSVYNTGFSQGYYDFVFGISPTDANIYFLGVTTLFKSIDGGLNFSALGGYSGAFGTHPDTQDLVMFGNNVVISTDGGVSVSSDNFTSLSNWHSTCKGIFALEYWGFDVGFNTDQMGGGKYHNGNNIFNTNWTNRKSIFLGGSEEATGKAILSRPNALSFSKYEDDVFKLIDVDYNPIVTNSSPITLSNNDEYYGTRGSDTTWNTIYSNIIYAGTENNVVISYDNGASSQILKNFNSRVWDIKTTRKDANVLYVMTETDGLWKTVDGGLNWTVCNLTVNSVNLKPSGLNCFIDVSQTNVNEIWLTYRNSNTTARISKSTDGGQTWTNLNTATLNQFESCQIIHQYGSNGGVYLMGKTNGIAKCYYRNNTMTDWIDYSSNLMLLTAAGDMFMKATYHKEKLRVAGTMGIQEVSFYEKSNPVAQPTTNIKDICVNQEIKFNDYSILDYTGASWEWSFSKVPTYLNGTTSGSQNPVVKFLSPGTVSATLKITNSSGASDSKTITNFINVNYDSANCLLLDSDHEIDLSCVNNIVSSPNIAEGSQVLVSNFDGATTGKFLVNLNFFTNCTGANGSLIAYVNLNTNQINVIRYNHFGGNPMDMLGNNTSTVTSPIGISAKVAFSISNHSLYLNHISNACSSSSYVRLSNSCWKPYGATGVSNGDLAELQKCNTQIQQSASVTNTSDILVTNFSNATSGLFYVSLNAFTTCSNTSNNLKAIVNLNSDVIHVLDYKHFGVTASSSVSGNETNSVTSTLNTNAQVNYFISNKKLYIKRILDSCGGSKFTLNTSCWSSMDDDQNGIDNSLQPSNCNNSLSTNVITDANTYLVKDFSSIAAAQSGVFVNLNINNSCNTTNATVYLSVDFGKNIIHVINYSHFGSTKSSTVLNNDSPNVYSESVVNGKLKFLLIDNKLYIQRLSTPCAGSTYQVTNSCYSLAADQVLVMENFISKSDATIIAYPNPTTGQFIIDTKTNTDDFSLSFYNIDGKYITPKFEKTDTNKLQVNMEQYAEGLYFLILFNKTDNKYNYLKIIKK